MRGGCSVGDYRLNTHKGHELDMFATAPAPSERACEGVVDDRRNATNIVATKAADEGCTPGVAEKPRAALLCVLGGAKSERLVDRRLSDQEWSYSCDEVRFLT